MTGQTVREVSTGVSVKAFGGIRIERKVVIVIGPGDGVDKWEFQGEWADRGCAGAVGRQLAGWGGLWIRRESGSRIPR